MALGNETENLQTIYLSVNNGKIVRSGFNNSKQFYDFVEGSLMNIKSAESNFKGELVKRWYINLKDNGVKYAICLPYSSGTFKSIILALASLENINKDTKITIHTYLKDKYTKVQVKANGTKLDWAVTKLPPIKNITVGNKSVKDDSERMKLISNLVNTINNRLDNKL